MMSRFTGATEFSHKIEIESKEINNDVPQDKEPAIQWHSDCCIYKVPKRLRKVNKKAYTPKLISIGPIHRRNPELKDMQMLKQRYRDKYFPPRAEKAKEEFESIIKDKEAEIRKCYAEEITLPCGKEFVDMILLDSIFIIELFQMTAERKKNKKDYILSKPWLEAGIKYDLRLLENQLPLFILNKLYALNKLYILSGDTECFITLACIYFFPDHPNPKELSTEMKEVKHFTDLHRTFYHPPPPHSKIRDPSDQHPIQKYFQYSDISAKKLLDTAGLIFEKPNEKQFGGNPAEEKRHLLDIQLKKPWENRPTINSSCLTHYFESFSSFKCFQTHLVVPQFVVEDGTEELFRNLMALEQCHYPFKAYICNYIMLLDFLINSKEDVELLVDKRIIVNWLGSSEAVARMVNNLCLEIIEIKSCYRRIIGDLNKLYDSQWNQNMATLRNVYFRDIWRGTATVVGVLVLFITIFNFLKPFVFKNI